MGEELINLARQCEAMTRNAFAVNEGLEQAAARYREEAKRVFVHIENCSLLTGLRPAPSLTAFLGRTRNWGRNP